MKNVLTTFIFLAFITTSCKNPTDKQTVVVVPPPVEASFDCSLYGLSIAERTICASAELRGMDMMMAGLFRSARNEQRATVADQREWIAIRGQCEESVDCLLKLYRQRIRQLTP